jgi:stage II sporulation protein D
VKRPRLDRYDVVSNQNGLRAPGVRNDVASIRFRADGGVTIDGKSYRGDLVLTRMDGGRIEAVNVLTMEDYLRGVVSGEMPRTFPAAALEAQAIVARTYALATVSGLRSGSTLILADDVSDQVYRGRSAETSETDAAVARTKGLVVVHDGNPIVAYFHSTCGGHTSDPAPVLKRPTSPPLRGVECGFCADSPHYRWTVELTRDDARRALVACGLGAPAVAAFSLVPGTTDDGGRLLEFRATSGSDGGESGVDANAFRLAVGSRTLKATRVDSIESRGGSLRFTGGGFGHGCGLCQYGSRGLAMAGRDSLGILSHYFPGSSIVRVYPVNGADATAQR